MVSDLDHYAATVQIYGVDEKNIPSASGSGMLARIGGKRYVFTVLHNSEGSEKLGVHLDHEDSGSGSNLWVPKDFGKIACAKLCESKIVAVEDVDFLWFGVPDDIVIKRTSFVPIGGQTRIVCREFDFDKGVPDMSPYEKYSFAGVIKPSKKNLKTGAVGICGELKVHREFSYIRTCFPYHVFDMPYDPFPGAAEFKGCSGAPILDSKGMPVALVVGRTPEMPFYGVGLQCLCSLIKQMEAGS